jgi:hypothetical protein
MTRSTISTVSTEEVKRFAEKMAQEIGVADLLQMETWAHPHLRTPLIDMGVLKPRNSILRLRVGEREPTQPC